MIWRCGHVGVALQQPPEMVPVWLMTANKSYTSCESITFGLSSKPLHKGKSFLSY